MSPTYSVNTGMAGAQEGCGENALAPMRAPQPDETDQTQANRECDDYPQDEDLFHGSPHSNAST